MSASKYTDEQVDDMVERLRQSHARETELNRQLALLREEHMRLQRQNGELLHRLRHPNEPLLGISGGEL